VNELIYNFGRTRYYKSTLDFMYIVMNIIMIIDMLKHRLFIDSSKTHIYIDTPTYISPVKRSHIPPSSS
jgi:hypothetical protein